MSRSPAAANQAASSGAASRAPAGRPAPCAKTPAMQPRQLIAMLVATRAPPEKPVAYTRRESIGKRAAVSSTSALTAAWISAIGPLRALFEPATIQPKRSAGSIASRTGRAPWPPGSNANRIGHLRSGV